MDAKPAETRETAVDGAAPDRPAFKGSASKEKGRPSGPRPDRQRFDATRDKPWEKPRDKPRDKPMDPNSPFAILGALRANMANQGGIKKDEDKS